LRDELLRGSAVQNPALEVDHFVGIDGPKPTTNRACQLWYTLFMNGVDTYTLGGYRSPRRIKMRRQFVLDKRTNKLLEELASYRAGNRSMVVREAIQLYADMEDRLDKIEADPGFQRMMEKSDADIKAGRVMTHAEVLKMSRAKNARSKKR
jgi:predicted transcriptional regulator